MRHVKGILRDRCETCVRLGFPGTKHQSPVMSPLFTPFQAGALSLANTGVIETVSNNTLQAGQIDVVADSITIDGKGSTVNSENQAGKVARQADGSVLVSMGDTVVLVKHSTRFRNRYGPGPVIAGVYAPVRPVMSMSTRPGSTRWVA